MYVSQYAGCKIIFFDAGVYYVTDTITIPAGTQVVGEVWPVILAGGIKFQYQTKPRVVVQAGAAGSEGVLEISDILFATVGPGKQLHHLDLPFPQPNCPPTAAGAILLEWNVHDPSDQQGAAGLWDTHIRYVTKRVQGVGSLIR